MKGLLLKDLYTLGNYKRIYIIMLAVAIGGNIILKGSNGFYVVFPIIYCALTVISIFSYDETARWDRYALALPVTPFKIVLSRYITALLILLASLLLCIPLGIASASLFGASDAIPTLLASGCVAAAFTFLALSVTFPACYKFGAEKGRYIMAFTLLALFLVFVLVIRFGGAWAGSLFSAITSAMLFQIVLWAPVATLVLLGLSLVLSVHIYRKKSF